MNRLRLSCSVVRFMMSSSQIRVWRVLVEVMGGLMG